MVIDFDCWHQAHENVEVTDIIKILNSNAASAKCCQPRPLTSYHAFLERGKSIEA